MARGAGKGKNQRTFYVINVEGIQSVADFLEGWTSFRDGVPASGNKAGQARIDSINRRTNQSFSQERNEILQRNLPVRHLKRRQLPQHQSETINIRLEGEGKGIKIQK